MIRAMQIKMGSKSIRPMAVADLDAVINIEQQAHSHPWTRGMFQDCLSSGYRCYVLEHEKQVMGYGIITLQANEAHILNLCIAVSRQRSGYGEWLLLKLLGFPEMKRIHTVFLEVRQSNIAAINLYNKCGFNEIASRKNYYPAQKGRETALIMAKELNIFI